MTSEARKAMTQTEDYRALLDEAVLIDGDSHDILRATGNDRVSFLHRITSGRIAGIAVGQGGRTLLLDVRGHVLASLVAFVGESSVRLVASGGQGAEVASGLGKFAIMDDFQVAAEAELATLAMLGPKAPQALAAIGVAVSPDFLASPLFAHLDVNSDGFGPLWLAHGRRCGVDGICVVGSSAARPALVQALLAVGTPRLSAETAEAARIAALEPATGKEITAERFPVEVGLGPAIDNTKGCYVGQETIVRMRDRGIVRRRLVLLRLGADSLAGASDPVALEGQPAAGQVTSAGCLPGEAPVALAILATAVPVGATVQVQHGGAALPATVAAESAPWG
jgi:folate-binding protein YgfZ